MNPLRIVSLLPSATEIIYALGLGDSLVGRSHECDSPPGVQTLPVCSRSSFPVTGSSREIDTIVKWRVSQAASLFELDLKALTAAAPTHIVTQSQCAVCAVSLADVERSLQAETASAARLISLEPNALADIWRDIVQIGSACGRAEAGERLVVELTDRMSEIAEHAAGAEHQPSVACLEWLEPLMAAGNWIPELVAKAGGRNLFGEAGRHSPWMTWDDLETADPDVVIALPCGFDLQRTREESHWLTGRPGWGSLRAARLGDVYLCDGSQFMNRPGPRVVESLRIFAEILHPALFPPTLEHAGWERL